MVFFRVDANKEIATGHVMRCLTIADAIKKYDDEIKFIISDNESEKMICSRGYEIINLATDWKNLMLEVDQMKSILYEKKSVLFIDTYSVTPEYVVIMKQYARIVCMDDMFTERFDADILINYNGFYNRFPYAKRYQNSKTKLLLGCQYVPLRNQFQIDVKRDIQEVRRILLISGGGDQYNFLGDFAQWTMGDPIYYEIQLDIVVGAMNQNINQLFELQRRNNNIVIHNNVSNMAKLMLDCDLAISAASTVLYECCSMQLPTIFFISSEDQIYDKDSFTKDGMMLFAGDIRKDKKHVFQVIGSYVLSLQSKIDKRRTMCEKMKFHQDGNGANRIALEIRKLLQNDIGM